LLLAARRAWNPPAWLVTRIDRRRAIHIDTEGCAARRCNCKSSMRLHSGANLRAGHYPDFWCAKWCAKHEGATWTYYCELLSLDLDQSIACPHVQVVG